MNINLEFEDKSPNPNNIEDNHPRTNYGAGYSENLYSKEEVIKLLQEYTKPIVVKLKEKIKILKKEKAQYEKAFEELICYFDSISDEEQPKISKRLERIFKN